MLSFEFLKQPNIDLERGPLFIKTPQKHIIIGVWALQSRFEIVMNLNSFQWLSRAFKSKSKSKSKSTPIMLLCVFGCFYERGLLSRSMWGFKNSNDNMDPSTRFSACFTSIVGADPSGSRHVSDML